VELNKELEDLKKSGKAPKWMSNAGYVTVSKGYRLKGETPREMYLRVSNSAANFLYKNKNIKKIYNLTQDQMADVFFQAMWNNWLCPASPVLSNLGTERGLPISCLTGDSWLNTKKEGGKQIKDIEIGDEVLTHKGRWKRVINKQKRFSKNELYELKVATRNTPIKITGNHPVLTNLGWVRVDELTKEHLIATNQKIENPEKNKTINMTNYIKEDEILIENNFIKNTKYQTTPIFEKVEVTEELCWAFGLWFAEGSQTVCANKEPNGIRITMNISEEDHVKRFLQIMKKYFNVNGNMYTSQIKRNGKINKWITCNVNSKYLGNMFKEEFGIGCKNKNTPAWLKELPQKHLKSFFDGFYLGDGKKQGKAKYITISNPKLAMSLYEIALKSGYLVGLQMQEKAGKLATTRYVYRVTIYNLEKVSLRVSSCNAGVSFENGLRYCPYEIQKIEDNADVYDITVEDDHSFSVSGVVVHNCYGNDVGDSVQRIMECAAELAMLSKNSGGVGMNWNRIRPRGSLIKNGANGTSEGIIPFAKIYDSTIIGISQGSTRRGAASGNLNIEHGDWYEFVRMRRPEGDINRQCGNLHHCTVVNDDFMQKVVDGDPVSRSKWAELMKTRMETGEPYIMFKDNINKANPAGYKKLGLEVDMTNICSEITLFTDDDHSFICCLASLNLVTYDNWKTNLINGLSLPKIATLFLNGVLNEFIDKAKSIFGLDKVVRHAIKGRAIGIGVLGWHTLLQSKNMPFESFPTMMLNSEIFKFINTEAIQASQGLAEIFGEPEWCQESGLYNSHLIAIAPTRSNSIISGDVSPGIEPIIANAYVDKTAKGTFIRKNPYLMILLEKYGKNDDKTWKDIARKNGSVQHLDFLSDDEKNTFKTAYEINQMAIITQAAQRQQFVCQSQSLNLFFPIEVKPSYFNKVHIEAWKMGIKTLYYCRSKAGIQADVANREEGCASCES